MTNAVAGQECDAPAGEQAGDDRRAGPAKGSIQVKALQFAQPAHVIQAGSADDPQDRLFVHIGSTVYSSIITWMLTCPQRRSSWFITTVGV